MEAALFVLTRQHIRLYGAGRTDSGVHACGQVAHCDVPDGKRDWRYQLNSVLPKDIQILAVEPVSSDFHARFDALSKTYVYRFWQQKAYILPHLQRYVWACGPLDVEAIRPSLGKFLGMHDFASFQNCGTHVQSTEREILDIGLFEEPVSSLVPGCLPLVCLRVTGTGFLKQMVRNMAGFLLAISQKKATWQELDGIMLARDRTRMPGITAPACGLCLLKVEYERII